MIRFSVTDFPQVSATSETSDSDLANTFTLQEDLTAILRKELAARRFAPDRPPREAIPHLSIQNKPVCTPGNLTTVIAKTKAGKSAYVGAAIAAVAAAELGLNEVDVLGWQAAHPQGKRLIHIDTEQSPRDHYEGIKRQLRRLGLDQKPSFLDSYCLTDIDFQRRREALSLLLEDAHADGIFAVIIDGVGDLVSSVNDQTECIKLVAELHAAAITYDCPIMCVMHDNEGARASGDGRGHLGKELMRKSESNLCLSKKNEVTVVWSDKMRRNPILKTDGPRFRFDQGKEMHLSCSSLRASGEVKKGEELYEEARACLADLGQNEANRRELISSIANRRGIGPKGAEKRYDAMRHQEVLVSASNGLWMLSPHLKPPTFAPTGGT